jgi:hypothetical protein
VLPGFASFILALPLYLDIGNIMSPGYLSGAVTGTNSLLPSLIADPSCFPVKDVSKLGMIVFSNTAASRLAKYGVLPFLREVSRCLVGAASCPPNASQLVERGLKVRPAV